MTGLVQITDVFVATVFPFCCSEEHRCLGFTAENNFAGWNPVPFSIFVNSPAEVKTSDIG